ncbi:VOC family protein [Pseudobacteriovorax antillogorgiicola]|uniref:VOC domain-containing protein n=1 Tax=Pseudobacteriovorax antillogorgiicola TaxID=1513793 RepID=A0A1Y6CR85_9BACT|nr:VOC family protein [Pseudobacteriovorax antillogorgiicola]TCS41268.1 hypothetical protein EDD56_14912 [Pseudobacteriovorax antillogorgiicola]SMF83788.1 hypothetical protein SAMN06296036_14912 [Pseudobacteriovorax antillogorgiicola]
MGFRDSYKGGIFSWVDLQTTDIVKVKPFYRAMFGWDLVDEPTDDGFSYTLACLEGRKVAGLAQAGPDVPHSMWQSYINVEKLDNLLEQVPAFGGQILMAPMEVSKHGRMACIKDPGDAVVYLWERKNTIGAEWVNDPNTLCWNELNTRQLSKSKDFYSKLFAWNFKEEKTGSDSYTTIEVDGWMNGGMLDMNDKIPEDVPPHWNIYFNVANLQSSLKTCQEHGGTIVAGPMEVPVGPFAIIADPSGAHFTVIECKEVDP